MTNTPTAQSVTSQSGFTLIEVTVTLIVTGLMLASFTIATSAVLDAREAARQKETLTRNATLAMQRMVTAVSTTPQLMLPLANDPDTARNEALRERRIPPVTGQENQTAVLAVTMSPTIDRDGDGYADADNDRDGRVDEDPGKDSTNDNAPGIIDIDDDNDGSVDEGFWTFNDDNDDEDGSDNEDPKGNGDNDTDLSIDEDPPGDLNNDNAPGIAGVDDDGDGLIDEGSDLDDDEDGSTDEDWYDPIVFYLSGSNLVERQAFPYDFTGNGSINGRDFVEVIIAEDVSYFRVERISNRGGRSVLVDITLELSNSDGGTVSLNTRVRAGDSI